MTLLFGRFGTVEKYGSGLRYSTAIAAHIDYLSAAPSLLRPYFRILL
jgi:hypothetical protein